MISRGMLTDADRRALAVVLEAADDGVAHIEERCAAREWVETVLAAIEHVRTAFGVDG